MKEATSKIETHRHGNLPINGTDLSDYFWGYGFCIMNNNRNLYVKYRLQEARARMWEIRTYTLSIGCRKHRLGCGR